jgi:hypothetical protein
MIAKLKCLLAQQSRARERYRKQLQRIQNNRKKHALRSVLANDPSDSLGPNPESVIPSQENTIQLDQLTPKPKTRTMLENTDVPLLVHKTLLFHHTLVIELNETRGKLTTEKEKRLASKFIRGKNVKKYRLLKYAGQCGISTMTTAMRDKKENGINLNGLNRKKRSDVVNEEVKHRVEQFYVRDDNSRMTTGRKETVTRHKDRKQKRIMLDTMTNLHEKFYCKNIDCVVSYATSQDYVRFGYASLKPKTD